MMQGLEPSILVLVVVIAIAVAVTNRGGLVGDATPGRSLRVVCRGTSFFSCNKFNSSRVFVGSLVGVT